MEKFRDFIKRSEESPIGPSLWIATALAIIFARDSIESIVSVGSFPEADLFHLFHVPVFFLSLLLAIILLLHFFSKEKIDKVSRVSLLFFTIILFPALLDFFISQVVKREVTYQYIEQGLAQNLLQFLNPFVKLSQVPFSLRLEVAFISLLSFVYIFLKRRSVSLSVLGALSVFLLCVFYGSIPAVLSGIILALFRFLLFLTKFFQIPASGKLTAVVDENVVVILQLLFGLALFAVWFARFDPKKLKVLYRDLRLTRILHYILLSLMGGALYFYDAHDTDIFFLVRGAGMVFALFFVCQFCAVLNDIFDIEGDRISNKERPLVAGVFEKKEYLKIGFVYLTIGLLFALWVSLTCLMMTLLFVAVYFLYSAPPLRLKRFYPVNPVIIGLQALLVFLLGQASFGPAGYQPPFYASTDALIFVIFALSSHVKDLKDAQGDMACRVLTLPVMLGQKRARFLTAGFVFLSYLLAPFLFSFLFFSPLILLLGILFGAANFFYIIRKNSKETFVFAAYLVFGGILLVLLIKNISFS